MRISEPFICAASMFHSSNTGMHDVAFAGGTRTMGREDGMAGDAGDDMAEAIVGLLTRLPLGPGFVLVGLTAVVSGVSFPPSVPPFLAKTKSDDKRTNHGQRKKKVMTPKVGRTCVGHVGDLRGIRMVPKRRAWWQ